MKKFLDLYQQLSPRRKNVFTWLVFAIIVFALYGKTLSFNYCIDDQYYLWLLPDRSGSISEYFQSIFQRFWGQQFRPVTYLTILLESVIFGETPLVHHITNLLYYSILCLVIFVTTKQFFNNSYKYINLFAFVVTLLFLFHPSHANVVSSIKNREVILSLMFGILALSNWLKYIETSRFKFVITTVIFLLLGIFSKKDVATFFIIIPIIGWIYNKRKIKVVKQIIISIFLIVVIAISMVIINNYLAAPITSDFTVSSYENEFINRGILLYERIPYAMQILAVYEKFMLVPTGYHFYFGVDTIAIHNHWKIYPIILLLVHLIVIIGFVFYCFKNNKRQHLIGVILFFLSLAPFCISFATGYVAVRYSFIASLGFCIVLSQILFSIFYYLNARKLKPTTLLLPISILCLIWGYFSFQRSLDWKDIDTLYQADLPKIKNSANANRMAATFYYLKAESISDSEEKIKLLQQSQVYADQALKVFYPIEPAMVYKAKGLLLLNQKENATQVYSEIAKHFPNNSEANKYLAYEYKNQKLYKESVFHFEKFLEASPNNTNAIIELTQLYIFFNQFDKAIAINRTLFNSGNPYDALLNFGDLSIGRNDTLSALKNYNQAINIKQEEFIVDEVLALSKLAKNDTMIQKLEKIKSQMVSN